MTQLDAPPTGDQDVVGLIPTRSGNTLYIDIDRKIFSAVILSLLLIQEEQLLVSGEIMYTSTCTG